MALRKFFMSGNPPVLKESLAECVGYADSRIGQSNLRLTITIKDGTSAVATSSMLSMPTIVDATGVTPTISVPYKGFATAVEVLVTTSGGNIANYILQLPYRMMLTDTQKFKFAYDNGFWYEDGEDWAGLVWGGISSLNLDYNLELNEFVGTELDGGLKLPYGSDLYTWTTPFEMTATAGNFTWGLFVSKEQTGGFFNYDSYLLKDGVVVVRDQNSDVELYATNFGSNKTYAYANQSQTPPSSTGVVTGSYKYTLGNTLIGNEFTTSNNALFTTYGNAVLVGNPPVGSIKELGSGKAKTASKGIFRIVRSLFIGKSAGKSANKAVGNIRRVASLNVGGTKTSTLGFGKVTKIKSIPLSNSRVTTVGSWRTSKSLFLTPSRAISTSVGVGTPIRLVSVPQSTSSVDTEGRGKMTTVRVVQNMVGDVLSYGGFVLSATKYMGVLVGESRTEGRVDLRRPIGFVDIQGRSPIKFFFIKAYPPSYFKENEPTKNEVVE